MSFLSRVAAFAAMSLVSVGLAHSAPGVAAELARPAVAQPLETAPVKVQIGTPDTLTESAPTSSSSGLDQSIVDDATTSVDTAVPEQRFTSLDDAVAAQDPGATDDDLRCLASAIFFESHGEPKAGQLAVAQVIINRAKSGRFPSSICGVVTQRGQFSFVRGGVIPAIDAARAGYRTAVAIAKVALTGGWHGDAGDALFFHARRVAPSGRFTRVTMIGNHIFYR